MSPLQLLSLLFMLLASVYVRAQPVTDYGMEDYDAAMAQLRKELLAYRTPEKRWANQVRFGKRASSWASSVRFG